jgi:hypothetical protein
LEQAAAPCKSAARAGKKALRCCAGSVQKESLNFKNMKWLIVLSGILLFLFLMFGQSDP